MLLDEAGKEEDPFSEASLVSVKGYVPGLQISEGTWFGFEAKWHDDPKYGHQLAILKAPVFRGGMDANTVGNMLVTEGVSPILVEQLKNKLGSHLCQSLEKPDLLREVLEISSFEAEYLADRWRQITGKMRTLEMLNSLDLPRGKIGEVWALFGEETEKILLTNPWALVEVDGISFDKIDQVALDSGLGEDCPERHQGAVIFASRRGKSQGDLFMTSLGVLKETQKVLYGVEKRKVAEALAACHKDGRVVIDKRTREKMTAVYEPWFYDLEVDCASYLQERFSEACAEEDRESFSLLGGETALLVEAGESREKILWSAVKECSVQGGIQLSPEQSQGVYNGLWSPISILTGLPGTGKSTSMDVLVRILRATRTSFLLLAPTGIAAKRLGTLTKSMAYTIHRGLGARGTSRDERKSTYAGIVGERKAGRRGGGKEEFWSCSLGNPHSSQVIIVDEFSMVDQHLLFRILEGTRSDARLVFIGDAAQLPSVGPGNVLRDLIASKFFPVVSLTKIFRQEEQSDIVPAAHDIHAGRVPSVEVGSDFCLLPLQKEKDVLRGILKLVPRLFQKAREDGSTFQVLSPRHMGTLGVTNLNNKLRNLLNPGGPGKVELKLLEQVVREGDRVMVVRNNYKLGVFNGDIGKIVQISRKHKSLKVEIGGYSPPKQITFSVYEAGGHLRLAYACTVHKYQGLEVDTVVMPLVEGFRHQLQRNLLYTAVTRAKRRVFLVGSKRALEKAVKNNREVLRNTFFRERLEGVFSVEKVEEIEAATSKSEETFKTQAAQ
jgi:exodeoxyribonuclease V alpha subunit